MDISGRYAHEYQLLKLIQGGYNLEQNLNAGGDKEFRRRAGYFFPQCKCNRWKQI
jgi:hypothetical protein